MDSYKEIAMRYLKNDKKRVCFTIIGASLAVMLIYTLLNVGWSYMLKTRAEVRSDKDYDIILETDDVEIMEQIIQDQSVLKAFMGSFYDYSYYESVEYDHALYIKVSNPYKMNSILDEFKHKYDINGVCNENLAWTYLQGDDAGSYYIAVLLILLVSYIVAIFGVGIVRNSIQLITLEQIKDYGNLRCIGASKEELRSIIYLQGFILESMGIGLGVIVGSFISLIPGHYLHINGCFFHLIPLIPVLIAFYGDLYFAMQETTKLVTKMTPVAAIRGEYRIKPEKIKRRRKSIYGIIFGIEGDYAYKNVMRNKGRFLKTVVSLSVGMAATMTAFGITESINRENEITKNSYGYYNIYLGLPVTSNNNYEGALANLPKQEDYNQFASLDGCMTGKVLHMGLLQLYEADSIFNHLTSDYKENSLLGFEASHGSASLFSSAFSYGYDEEDMKRYENYLVEGTLPSHENGILLLNGGYIPSSDETGYAGARKTFVYTDYHVGDTIEIFDTTTLRERFLEKRVSIEESYKQQEDEYYMAPDYKDNQEEYDNLINELFRKKNVEIQKLFNGIKDDLRREGAYRTLVIDGIVNEDPNFENDGTPSFIMTNEQFYDYLGTASDEVYGMKYHFSDVPVNKYFKVADSMIGMYQQSSYPIFLYEIQAIQKIMAGVALFILFIVALSIFNIFNTATSNLHMRKKELAQLRVIGLSKKKVCKIVMLEGVISSIAACIVGIICGWAASYYFFTYTIAYITSYSYHFPVIPTIVSIIVVTLILCGSLYIPLRKLPLDIASDLTTAGE